MKDLKTALAEVSNRILAGIPNGQANNSFLGPSLYFSQEALKACQTDFLGERHIEMVYATWHPGVCIGPEQVVRYTSY